MGRAYWGIVADEIGRDGWCWGMCEIITNGQRLWIVDAYKIEKLPRYVVRADTLLGAFLALKSELKADLSRS